MGEQNYLALSGRVKINPHPKIHHSLSGCQATYPPTLGFDVHVELEVCLKFETKQYCFSVNQAMEKGLASFTAVICNVTQCFFPLPEPDSFPFV